MSMKKRDRKLLWVAGAALGGFAAYRWLYRPWRDQQLLADAAATAGGNGGGYSTLPDYSPAPYAPMPGPASMITMPTAVGPTPGATLQDQIDAQKSGVVNSLGTQYSGPLGACIAKKGGTWSPEKCQQRLNDLIANYRLSAQTIMQLKGQAAGGNIPSLNALLAANKQALVNAQAGYKSATANGDAAGAQTWAAAIAGHTADINALQLQLAATPQQSDNQAAIAAYQGQMAALNQNYFELTGSNINAA